MNHQLSCIVAILALACNLANGAIVKITEEEEGPIVHLKNGAVRGLVAEAEGKKVNFFQGIRFGRAERFHKPTPEVAWNGVYLATKQQFSCPQSDTDNLLAPNIVISEDCLFLNVFVPATVGPKSNFSVMFWIYGGAFQEGTIFSDIYNARYISGLGDVVVVTVNYRLGPLGFASFGTKETPGNLGLYDQILGLKWVQENIQKFGGNPNDVTIFGESAGSMSVGSLVLSPLTTGLFHRAILQSGTPNSRMVEKRTVSLNRTISFAQRLGCKVHELPAALKCMQNKTMEELVKTSMGDFAKLDAFVPLYGDGDELLPEDPVVALKKFDRKIDLMFGVVRNEGTMFVGMMFPEINMVDITLQSALNGIEKMFQKIELSLNESEIILNHYTGHLTQKSSKDELRKAVSDIIGDYALVCPTVLFGEQVARRNIQKSPSNNHFYSYRLMAPLQVGIFPDWMGVVHSEDVMYLFGLPIQLFGILPGITKENVELSRDMITAWTQFAKTGQIQPVSGVKWTEAVDRKQPEKSSVSYLSLDPTSLKMVDNYWKEICDQIWKPLLEAHL